MSLLEYMTILKKDIEIHNFLDFWMDLKEYLQENTWKLQIIKLIISKIEEVSIWYVVEGIKFKPLNRNKNH